MAARAVDSAHAQRLLENDDSDVEGLFDSPVRRSTTPEGPLPVRLAKVIAPQASKHNPGPSTNGSADSPGTREEALQTELAQLQQMNATIENLNQSLTAAKSNLQTMQTNMNSAKTLLKTWSSILSQAEHNQRLILDSRWQGATKDLEDIASEDLRRQADAQRKIVEENARREAAQRKQEEEARKREADQQKKTRGIGRTRSVRGTALGTSASTRGPSSTTTVRGRGGISRGTTSGIARGSTIRGRGRG